MTIALVNYRYFISGGPERYYFNIKEILENHGHKVIPFSIKSSRNLPNDYEKYFLDIVDDEVYFAQAKKKTPKMILKSFTRMFYSREAKKKMEMLIRNEKPDLIYIMQMHNKISPSIVDAARKYSIPVIHRISDFQYMCPNALFYNDRVGVCEDCLHGKRMSCIKYKCVLNSTLYSGIKAAAKWYHDFSHVTKKIDSFVVPSSFTLGKLKEYGIPEQKLHHIPTFFNLKEEDPVVEYKPFFLFVGRIEKQKGLMTMIKAFAETDLNLKIIGFSNDGYEEELKAYLADKKHNIEFLGRMDFNGIVPYLKSCLCTIVPSEWYDNFPNVILESFAYKKAVIATDFGSLPELVINGQTGLLFKYGSPDDLLAKAKQILSPPPPDGRNNGHQCLPVANEQILTGGALQTTDGSLQKSKERLRILLCNKFYYRRGGDCIYMLNLEQLLKDHGHEVAVFAMDYPENLDTLWKKYFPGNMSKLMAFTRPFGSSEIRSKFGKLLDDFRPDVVHLNNVHTQLSPLMAELAHKRGIRVVWTLHDYKLLCPRYDCLRGGEEVCELCFSSDKSHCQANKCMKGSTLASIIGRMEAEAWTRERLEACTDLFICPSQFMADKMAQGGFNKDKMKVLCNFIDTKKCIREDYSVRGDYYCYVGRLSHEKGVKTLIEAANRLPYKLKVIGGGPLEGELKGMAKSNVEFVGYKQWDEIKELVGKARFTVIPSEWYENNPLSVIEAQCLGTPVLGARIGGIPELIEEGKTGMTFERRNVSGLKDSIELMFNSGFNHESIASESQTRYSSDKYYQEILTVYSNRQTS